MARQVPTSDAVFVRRAKKGDPQAFQSLVSGYRVKLSLYLRHLGLAKDEAEDLLQDVFMKAFRGLPGFDGRKRFSPWIYRIAHNEAINYLKRKSRRKLVSWEDIASSKEELNAATTDETPEEAWMRKETQVNVRRALASLPENDRELVVLRYFLEKSYSEIAEIFDSPENTIASRLHRVKEKLLKELLKGK
jgi:RNA polymerase sigma-70 factor (ECF subfamily)